MPTKMHNDLKMSAIVLQSNMQDIILQAISNRLNFLKLSNKDIDLFTKDKSEIKENINN